MKAPGALPGPGAEIRALPLDALPLDYGDDGALVEALLEMRPAAARALWERYATLVRRLLRRTLGSDDVDDMLQEAFLRVLARVASLRDVTKLRSFVVGVTLRVAREELRRRRVRRWLRLWPTAELPERSTRGADFDAAEALARLDAVLARLDPDTRIVFVLRFVEQTPTREIAELLSCSLATAKRKVQRAQRLVERAAASEPALAAFVVSPDAGDAKRCRASAAGGGDG